MRTAHAGLRLTAGLLCVALLGSACGVPQRKDTSVVSKPAASPASARSVVATYNAVRARADERLDASLLPQIEGGDLLDIDQGAYFVSVRVDKPEGYATVRLAAPEQVVAPRFEAYPLWFVVLARDQKGGNKRVAVFERADSVSPWLMTMAPETTPQAGLPPVVQDSNGAAVTVAPDDATGTGVSPTAAVQRYAGALAEGQSEDDAFFASDAFITQTRKFQQTQASLPFATFQQTWTPQTPRFALRVEGGGMLVFGTVNRRDAYSVQTNSYIDWDDNADTAAYLPGRVYRSATLDYTHQLLLFLPPRGEGRPRLIGQYGGVVDGQGS
jgi:hypothetical protein